MKSTYRPFWTILFITLLSGLLTSCEDKMDEYYKTPDWLKGSIYEVLEQRGNYSVFLKGIDIANMKTMVNGKSILTVMAPTDSAFTAYLNENYGGKKIEELPISEISKIIGFHVLYYSFDKQKLTNYRPYEGDGATDEEKNIDAGLYYKFRTKSSDSITIEKDTSGIDVSVYHLERFLPVFSHRMFQTKQIDAKYNYEYFFPNTSWKDADGFNVANAAVDEYAVIADNGYVYMIDKVLRPLETIYKELKSNNDYSDFLELYNAYEYYQLDENLTREYGNGTDLYQHYHTLANIACEWPVTDYRLIGTLSKTSYSVFAPNNSALRSFFNDYWKIGGYDSLAEVSETSIAYLLFNSVYASSIVFPEEIKKGLIENSFGTIINFNVDAVKESNRKICVNGALYQCEELTPPAMFGSVTGPAFQYKKYSYFLDMLNVSDLVLTLASDETRFIMLYPSDSLMNQYGIIKQNEILYKGASRLSSGTQQNYVYAHVMSIDGSPGSASSLPSSGTHVLRTLSPSMNLYWYMKDGKITNCIKHNELLYIPGIQEDDIYSEISELTFRDGWTNGKCYSYSNPTNPYIFEGDQSNAIYNSFIPMILNNRSDSSTLFYGFTKLLESAEMVDLASQSILAVIESSLMFVPTTSAVKNGILNGKIPGISTSSSNINDADFFTNCIVSNIDTLKYYMLQYFIPLSTAVISNFPYIGWQETTPGGLPTLQSFDVALGDGKVETKTTKISVTDANNKISIQVIDTEGNPVGNWIDAIGDYHYFPFVFDDGCVHFIKEVL
ncbi:MAG: fasciclin domain-containing protein [Marinilabiliaceae bacterium]|nr:fasciclin domain-containing protein [Marinilabiliaceae bacterium]